MNEISICSIALAVACGALIISFEQCLDVLAKTPSNEAEPVGARAVTNLAQGGPHR